MMVFRGAAGSAGSEGSAGSAGIAGIAGFAGIAGDYLDEAPPGESSGGKRGLCGSGGGGYW